MTIRFAGDSGDGMQLTGNQFTTNSALFGNDIATSFSSVASCLNNLGPAVGDAVNSYSSLSTSSKYVLSFTMILGRLEIYTLLIILTPYFWKY